MFLNIILKKWDFYIDFYTAMCYILTWVDAPAFGLRTGILRRPNGKRKFRGQLGIARLSGAKCQEECVRFDVLIGSVPLAPLFLCDGGRASQAGLQLFPKDILCPFINLQTAAKTFQDNGA